MNLPGSADANPVYTVFIPTFNRAHTIEQALHSADAQSFRRFEILVIDDGSTDDTAARINALRPTIRAPLRYHWQPNQGKHVAYNTAAEHARGDFLVLLDSDDVLLPEALATLERAWQAIPVAERSGVAGVEGLCQRSDGSLHGTRFPQDPLDTDYLTCRRHYGVTGEKRHSLRTDLLRATPYPVIPGERHVRPDYVWKRLAHNYRMRHVNEVLQIVDFQPDGLTRNARRRRLRNPGGLYLYYRDDLLLHPDHLGRAERRRHCAQYIRYALRYGVGPQAQWREVPDHALWLGALPRGLQDWALDGLKALCHRDRRTAPETGNHDAS